MLHNLVLAQTIRSWLQSVFGALFSYRSLFRFHVPAFLLHLVTWLRRRRVPVILQITATECGAASLAMILSYYGRETGVAEIRAHTDVGRDGLTARTIAQTARTFGLRVKAYSAEPVDLNHLQLPAIIHWRFNHFVVLERWSPQQVVIVDPALGRRTVTPAEFEAEFTGVVLTLEPGIHFTRRSEASRSYWRLYVQQALSLPGMVKLLLQILGASLFLQLFGLAIPLFTKILVDNILPFTLTSLMPMLGLGLLVLLLTQFIANYLRAGLLIYLQARLDAQLMLGFFEHVLSLPFAFFQQRSSGDLLMRLGSNATIRQMLTSQTLSIVLDGLFVLVYLGLIFAQEALFGWLVLGLGLAQVALLMVTQPTMHRLTQRQLITQAESQSYLVEALAGIATVKAAGGEARSLDHWSNLFFKQLNASLRQNHLTAVVETVLSTFRTFSPLLLLWIGASYVLAGSWSLGNMLALSALAVAVLTPLASLVSAGRQLQLAGAHMARIADVLRAEPEQDERAVQPVPPLSGQIELDHVSFQYNAETPLVLRDISLTIHPGQKVALVGRSGSGKSTLAKLLIGLYWPTSGEIRYDDLSLPHLNLRSLRRQFGGVLQESFLFNGSIRQNIAFNEPTLALEAIVAAAQRAAIDEDIMAMPMGYETLVAEGGTGLSGGQRQRLALARALAHQPAILLLDEATSHLDVVTEQVVDQNLDQLNCTRIVIAHRLSTVRNADLILVLDGGQIIERGMHDELLAAEGYYADLVHRQLEREAPIT